jgi:hypothetical protein
VQAARADPDVVGLVLTGSRGRGVYVRPESDWDVRMVVREEARARCRDRYAAPRGSPLDVALLSPSELERAGAIGSPTEWDRYSYVHAQVVLDKLEGRIAELVAEKSVLPADVARPVAERALDTYVNSYYRSVKNRRDGLATAAHLDAAESISPFLTALFAIQGRVRPFNRFLRWELERFPLDGDLWSADRLLPRLEAITATGDPGEQQRLFRDAERLARERGLEAVVDEWEPDLSLLRGEG